MSLLWKTATGQSLQHVPMEDLPVHPAPYGISDQDVPKEYAGTSGAMYDRFAGTYSLQHVPLESLHPGHEHNADCYRLSNPNVDQWSHDVADDDHEGEDYDYHYV
jgi:hypothetical protein